MQIMLPFLLMIGEPCSVSSFLAKEIRSSLNQSPSRKHKKEKKKKKIPQCTISPLNFDTFQTHTYTC